MIGALVQLLHLLITIVTVVIGVVLGIGAAILLSFAGFIVIWRRMIVKAVNDLREVL